MTKDTRFRPSGQAACDYASEYIARGWAPIPVPWRSKNPGYDGWQHLRVTADTSTSTSTAPGRTSVCCLVIRVAAW